MEVAEKEWSTVSFNDYVYGIVCGIRHYLEEKNSAEGLNPLDKCDKK